jgi:UDP-glucose:(heptosyl)LPS alpha-1,3-glucosyltransferase
MQKVFFIRANRTKYGGSENYLSRLSNALTDINIDHQVINSIFPKFLPSWLRVILFNFQVCLTKKNKLYFSLDRIICPDIYRAGDGVHKVFLSIERKSKTNLLHPIYLFLEKKCFNKARHIIANSNMIRNEIINTYQINPEKISVIYNGVKIKEFNYQQSFDRLSKEFPIDYKQKILLYVGSGFERKGVEEFIQIVAKLKSLNLKAFIVGKDKNIEYYQELCHKLKIHNQVIFTGVREDVDDFYVISDIFLFPTHYEPFSNVVLEAMNFENVVFTTSQNGASEILEKKYIMKSPQDYSIVKEISNLLADNNAMRSVKQKNQLKLKSFSIEINLKKTLEIINEVSDALFLKN